MENDDEEMVITSWEDDDDEIVVASWLCWFIFQVSPSGALTS